MTATVSGVYASQDQLRNVRDDLLAAGIPDEKDHVNEQASRLSLLMPDATATTAVEILERHGLDKVSA